MPYISSNPYSIVLNDVLALETALKERVQRYRPLESSPLKTRVPCYRSSLHRPCTFAIHVEPSSREGPTGQKNGTIVLVNTTSITDKRTSRKKYEIQRLNSPGTGKQPTYVFEETLFPIGYISKQGCIPLLDGNGSTVKAKSASIDLDHKFLHEYEVVIETPAGSAASNAVSAFGNLFFPVTAPFEIFTVSQDGTLLKGVVLTLDFEKARIMFPDGKYACSAGETKNEKPPSASFYNEVFDVPIGSFTTTFIPVKYSSISRIFHFLS